MDQSLCLLFYILTTSKDISGRVPSCDSMHSSSLYCAASLRDQAISTMTWHPTQSHYPDTEPSSPCHILIMRSAWLGSDKFKFVKSLVWLDCGSNSQSSTHEATWTRVLWFHDSSTNISCSHCVYAGLTLSQNWHPDGHTIKQIFKFGGDPKSIVKIS